MYQCYSGFRNLRETTFALRSQRIVCVLRWSAVACIALRLVKTSVDTDCKVQSRVTTTGHHVFTSSCRLVSQFQRLSDSVASAARDGRPSQAVRLSMFHTSTMFCFLTYMLPYVIGVETSHHVSKCISMYTHAACGLPLRELRRRALSHDSN